MTPAWYVRHTIDMMTDRSRPAESRLTMPPRTNRFTWLLACREFTSDGITVSLTEELGAPGQRIWGKVGEAMQTACRQPRMDRLGGMVIETSSAARRIHDEHEPEPDASPRGRGDERPLRESRFLPWSATRPCQLTTPFFIFLFFSNAAATLGRSKHSGCTATTHTHPGLPRGPYSLGDWRKWGGIWGNDPALAAPLSHRLPQHGCFFFLRGGGGIAGPGGR